MNIEKLYDKFKSKFEDMGLDRHRSIDILNHIIDFFSSLPDKVKLYRIVFLDDLDDLDRKFIGDHYSYNKQNLLDSMYLNLIDSAYGYNPYLLTIEVDKNEIDLDSTISNNILYPNEEEITLKEKGLNAEIINIEKLEDDTINEIIQIKKLIDYFH